MTRRLAIPLLLGVCAVLSARDLRAAAAPVTWERSSAFPGLRRGLAVAFDPATGRLAAADAGSVWLRLPGQDGQRFATRGPVSDLAFGAAGELWIATDVGLFLRDGVGRVHDRSPGPGAAARAVRRIVVADGFLLCATAAGAHHALEGRPWTRLDAGLPDGDVIALAVRRAPVAAGVADAAGDAEIWMIADHSVLRARISRPRSRPVVRALERQRLAEAGRSALDLSISPNGDEVVVLSRRTLSRLGPRGWQTLRPALPPGAEVRRLGRAAGRLWIATDRGLIEVHGDGFRRASAPAGSDAIAALAGGPTQVFAIGRRGLLAGRLQAEAPRAFGAEGARALLDERLTREPDVGAVRRAALRYLDLGPEWIRSLRRRARRRGWLPIVELRGAYGGQRSHGLDWDEAFQSGEPRLFLDRERERERDFGLSASLRWDLGDGIYHPESVDVSKEARELVELRDDVLDEVTQLYFDRRRLLLELAARDSRDDLEAARLRLRADELASGLDAWTGGWWSRRVPALFPASPPGPTQENRP